MFSDIVGFSSLMEADESETLSVLEANEAIHLKAFSTHGGRLLKKLGDGLLSSFVTASGAVECAQEVASAVTEDGRFQVRIGIHLGEVIESDGDVFGDGVNISSRIQDLLQPGQIGFSKVVHDNVKNKSGFSSTFLGDYELKNLDEPVSLYLLDTVPTPDHP
jgi:adenylate cyclase